MHGDRKDGRLMRDLDSLHYVTGIIYPNRCDNEAFISEKIDLTNINKYLEEKNAGKPDTPTDFESYKYNYFQLIVTALMRTISLRPKMNRFIVNGNFYQRNELTCSFVVKKLFDDNGAEALAFIHVDENDTLDDLRKKLYDQISVRKKKDNTDATTGAMDILNKIPRFVSKAAIHFLMWLDKHGWVPQSIIEDDPYYSTAVISNLGSIKMKSGYHHLTNWGTCGVIMLIGEAKLSPFVTEDGRTELRPAIELGLTIDERLADGYYYSKTLKILRKLLQDPKLLEETMSTPVDYKS